MNFTLGSAGIELRSIPSVATLAPIGDQQSRNFVHNTPLIPFRTLRRGLRRIVNQALLHAARYRQLLSVLRSFKSIVIMSQESSVPTGPSGSALTETDFRVLIKESLLEVLQGNPPLLQTSVAPCEQSQRSISGEHATRERKLASPCMVIAHIYGHRPK